MEDSKKTKVPITITDVRIVILALSVIVIPLLYFIFTLPVYVPILLGVCIYKVISWKQSGRGSSIHNENARKNVNVCIVGAGFSGLCMGIKLKMAGIRFTIIEKSSDVGGTWWDNRYPGCACDVWSNVYQFTFFENPKWSCLVVPAKEISQYLRDAAKHFNLYEHIDFDTSVEKATWNEEEKTWKVVTNNPDHKEIVATHLVSACGVLRKPNLPDIPGIETFQGKSFHSQQMKPDLENYRGKRVAVVGSAASAVQICPAIVDHVKELYVFQRTPNWIIPKFNPDIPNWIKVLFTKIPLLATIVRLYLFTMFEFFGVIVLNKGFLSSLYKFALRRHYKNLVPDNEQLLEKITPNFGIGCKRILLSNDFIPMFASKKNAHLITDQIIGIDEDGITTKAGKHYEVDVIVYATGFSNEESICGFETVGREQNTTLKTYFDEHPTAYLGITVPKFPNMFLMLGPNTVLAHNSVTFMMECAADYALDCINQGVQSGISSLEVRKKVTDEFRLEMNKMSSKKNFQGNCRSWYKNKDGINFILWPSNLFRYWWLTRKAQILRDFKITFFKNE